MQCVFGAIVVLALAWATGSVMSDIGANRFFQELLDDINPDMLPTLTFAVSMLMAFATGTSWGTMAIIFPIVTVPAWTLSNNPELVISTIAAVLAGAVAGDHCSYISDTTVLSSIAAGCDLSKHVLTQAPYAFLVIVWSMLVGTIPVGTGAYSTGVALNIGAVVIFVSVILLGAPVLSISGRYDPFTEFYLFFRKKVFRTSDKELENLKEEVKVFIKNETLVSMTGFQKLCHQ